MAWTFFTPVSAKAAGKGLPQLDISTWSSQLFWLVVLFATGYVFMAKLVTPKIGKILEERRAKLDGDLDRARSASADAQRIREEYETSLETARNTAAEKVKISTTQAAKLAEANEAKVTKRLMEKVAKAEEKLAIKRNETLSDLNKVAAEAAVEAVAQIVRIKIDKTKVRKTAEQVASKFAKRDSI